MEFSGAVLAGGRSQRFGQDKALYIYRGKPLMGWVLGGMIKAPERFVVANRPYPEFGVPVYPDLWPGGGAMAGLHRALAHAHYEWVAVAACDQPFLSEGYWQHLGERISSDSRVVMAESEAGLEPLGALYHKTLEPLVLEQLRAGHLGLQAFLEALPAVHLSTADLTRQFGANLFANFNTVAELEALGG